VGPARCIVSRTLLRDLARHTGHLFRKIPSEETTCPRRCFGQKVAQFMRVHLKLNMYFCRYRCCRWCLSYSSRSNLSSNNESFIATIVFVPSSIRKNKQWPHVNLLVVLVVSDEPRYLSPYSDGLWAGRPAFEFRLGRNIILHSTASRLTLRPTLPPIECVPGVKRPGCEADHSPSSGA
jgi:hypothetical protein